MNSQRNGVSMSVFIAGIIIAILASSLLSIVIVPQFNGGTQGPEGPQGPQGNTGPQGEQGPPGLDHIGAMGTYSYQLGTTAEYNVESIVWNSDSNQYWVTFIDGIVYDSLLNMTVITCHGGTWRGYAGFSSQDNKLAIYIYNYAGDQYTSDLAIFSFVVFGTPK